MKNVWMLVFFIVLLTGCTNDKPKPEGSWIKGTSPFFQEAKIHAAEKKNSKMEVNHFVKNNVVYVECLSSDQSFALSKKARKKGDISINLYVDGKMHTSDIVTAAFTIRDLSKGRHHIRAEFHTFGSKESPEAAEWNVVIM
ncbi:hypothetical protein [Metabacillus sp. RGM 3146]|uniref:hypothetical protein n=1 Tax=Metabacillus sp. RGM 3146 TaxID=3401092 RepID=UPI003B996347